MTHHLLTHICTIIICFQRCLRSFEGQWSSIPYLLLNIFPVKRGEKEEGREGRGEGREERKGRKERRVGQEGGKMTSGIASGYEMSLYGAQTYGSLLSNSLKAQNK